MLSLTLEPSGMGKVRQKQVGSGKIRNLPLSNQLAGILLNAAVDCGVDVHVVSGGQPPKGQGTRRIGSTRHDVGGGRMGAADIQIHLPFDGIPLQFTNSGGEAIWSRFVTFCVKHGAHGVGAGVPYMGPSTVHIGGGTSAVWGSIDGKTPPPLWLVQAHKMGRQLR